MLDRALMTLQRGIAYENIATHRARAGPRRGESASRRTESVAHALSCDHFYFEKDEKTMFSKKRLLASYWSIAGDTYPGFTSEVSPFDFRERVEIAAAVGFNALGLAHQDLLALRDRLGYQQVRSIMAANGIKELEVETLRHWSASGDRGRASDAMRRDLLEAAEALGARHIKVSGDTSGVEHSTQILADSFGKLCADAARVGSRVGIEIMPWSNFATITRTMEMVNAAAAPNGGVLLDIWHVARGGIDMAEIGRLPKEAIISIEINDAAAKPADDLWEDTVHNRLLPGEGSFEIARFLSEVEKTGYDGPIGVEVLSRKHRKEPLRQAAETVYASAAKYLS